jgi:uncharacterized membrane protein (UPF0127 family)
VKLRLLVCVLAFIAFTPGCRAEPQRPSAEATPGVSPAGLEVVPLLIRSGEHRHQFLVEVARTPEQQARGLMYRPTLGPDEGMVFPFEPPRPASFWMKNTMIPLDMLFIRADGTIARIAANTVPYSLDAVEVGEPVAAVLEIAGGRSATLAIEAGDRVSWPGGPAS